MPLRLALLGVLITVSHAYIWPNPQLDALEHLRYDGHGYNSINDILYPLTPCSKSFPYRRIEGRSNAADWIRNAFHDFILHNVTDGTGGFDASTIFEIDRPESAGDSTNNAQAQLGGGMNRYISLSDMFAMGVVVAHETCGGNRVNFRGGRVDATEANRPGVPVPPQSLSAHISAFAQAGFSKEDMIGLVACGHAQGGIQHFAFPDLAPLPVNDTAGDVVAAFDDTPYTFDNHVAVQYIDGSTKNPLVVGKNATTNSDLRIFSSDGNATIRAFAASAEHFAETCSALFERMINTVPRGVVLSEVLEPLPVKPMTLQVQALADGTFTLTGDVRFWDLPENDQRVVRAHWVDREGATCASCSSILSHDPSQAGWSYTGTGENHTTLWYSFSQDDTRRAVIDPSVGISQVWFTVEEAGQTLAHDQDGIGFAVQDTLILSTGSCANITTNVHEEYHINFAIRSEQAMDRVIVERDIAGSMAVNVDVLELTRDDEIANGTYTLYSTVITAPYGSAAMNLAGDFGDHTFRTPWHIWFSAFPACA